MTLKPWREVAKPHADVLEGTFLQSEFAADLSAVHAGNASPEYQEAPRFFSRTFITEGMRRLLLQVLQRLAGKGGEPVVQLQTAFGGGKTHSMLAVYHLARGDAPRSALPGIPGLLDEAGLLDVPQARVAVLDGNALAPGQPWCRGPQAIHTLWGELAWQLGGEEGYALVEASDQRGTSPGKEVLKDLLERYAPCVVLIDELVAYIRQFASAASLSGGTLGSNLSFVQALTEAAKLVPKAMVLATLPESEGEAGGGVETLRSLEKLFGRLQALWRPVAAEEAFEIVRRRLFEPLEDHRGRDAVCEAFTELYKAEGGRLPTETQEVRYRDRLLSAYPIHPEVFDRLYEDWSSLEGFQRTRGVLKLMAKVIYRLWKDDNRDLLILPGSLPLYDGNTRNELLYHLPPGWDPVVHRDIDGENSEPAELDTEEVRFGALKAARCVARTLFLGSAPASVATRRGNRGLTRSRVLLGCLQPGQSAATYLDALNRLSDRLHYLNASGEAHQDTTRFWFDTRANLRREMEERQGRFGEDEITARIARVLGKVVSGGDLFEGVHVFTPSGDVPDDGFLRLVVLPPKKVFARGDDRLAREALFEVMKNAGAKPRFRRNRLLFLAADYSTVPRLFDGARRVLAWNSIAEDVQEGRLNIDLASNSQIKKEQKTAEDVLLRVAQECYRWLLCPTQDAPGDPERLESFSLNTGGATVAQEIEGVCRENELVISTWSPVHLRPLLEKFYWKGEEKTARGEQFWEDSQRYLYLPRLKNREVLERTIAFGAGSRDFFGTACGVTKNDTENEYQGFFFGKGSVLFDRSLLLMAPSEAARYEALVASREKPKPDPVPGNGGGSGGNGTGKTPTPGTGPTPPPDTVTPPPPPPPVPEPGSFYASAEVSASSAKMRLVTLAEEVIALLAEDPEAQIKVTLEINAEFPHGAREDLRRSVSENLRTLGIKNTSWD